MRRACVLLTTLLAGCQAPRATLSGEVTSLSGAALAATVRVEGLEGAIQADDAGAYALVLPLGRFNVRYDAPGYLPQVRPWALATPSVLRPEPVRLAPLPPAPGLWIGDTPDLAPVPEATLVSDAAGLGVGIGGAAWRVAGPATRWCAEVPLLHRPEPDEDELLMRAFEVDATRILWPRNAPPPPSIPLARSPFAEGVSAMDAPDGAGRIALLIAPEEDPDDPQRWVIHLLEIVRCASAPSPTREVP